MGLFSLLCFNINQSVKPPPATTADGKLATANSCQKSEKHREMSFVGTYYLAFINEETF